MNENLSLESLAQRLERLEQLLKRDIPLPRQKDWRRVVGIAAGSEVMRQINQEAQAIREADRKAAQELSSSIPIIPP